MPPRVLSLLPSATETICALGARGMLVGVSHECDHPPGLDGLPRVSGPKYPTDGTSYAIDQRVKAILQEALSIYRVDGEGLRALRPDLIVTQSQCAVCAISTDELEQAVAEWLDYRPAIVSLGAGSLDGIWADMRCIAEALEMPHRGVALVEALQERMAVTAARCATAQPASIVCLEWLDPLMAGGNWMPELVLRAGGRNLLGQAGQHSPWIGFDDLANADPDAILIAPCGFGIAQTIAELPALIANPGWAGLKAIRNRRVHVADGSAYFNRPGPRIAESFEILADILHPELGLGSSVAPRWVRAA
jgi:iron complex transport system substrate-binding protein